MQREEKDKCRINALNDLIGRISRGFGLFPFIKGDQGRIETLEKGIRSMSMELSRSTLIRFHLENKVCKLEAELAKTRKELQESKELQLELQKELNKVLVDCNID